MKKENEATFQCDCCGLCCQHLSNLTGYEDLDDGTGVCRYYNEETKLCTIYDMRPLKCNVQKAYLLYQQFMTYEEYLQLNQEGCKRLKEETVCHYHSYLQD